MTSPPQLTSTATTSDPPMHSQHSQQQAPITCYSQLNGPTPSNQAQTMTAPVAYAQQNGKKRKRLQKACAACHKAKRRCDGGLPCSNCAFAARTCLYTDANGNAVPPPPRNNVDHPLPEAFHHTSPPQYFVQPPPMQPQQQVYAQGLIEPQQHQYHHQHQIKRPRAMTGTSAAGSPHFSGPVSPPDSSSGLSWITAERRRSLLNVFFSKLLPYNCVIDELTFTRDLASDDVPPVLLQSILALSAPHEEASSSFASSSNRALRGEEFARVARKLLFEEDYHGNTVLDSPSLHTAQSLAFLSVHELSLGRTSRASLYIGNALSIVSALRLQEGYVPRSTSSRSFTSSSSSSISTVNRATCIRTACLVTILEVLVSILCGKSPVTQASDIEVLTLMSLPDALTCSFVRLTSSIALLSQVISAEKSASRSSMLGGGVHSRSHSARSEADGLLRGLQSTLPFDEVLNARNRQSNANELAMENGSAESKLRGWCWTVMHSMYSVSQIVLEKGINSTSNSAFENLIDLLSTLDSEGRRSLIVRLPLMVASKCSRAPATVLDWSAESNSIWGSNESVAENSMAILGLSSMNVNGHGAENGSSPNHSPPTQMRPLNLNATSPTLPPLIKSHSMTGPPHHSQHHGHGHSRSTSTPFSNRPVSPPSLPSLRLSQPDANNARLSPNHERLPPLSPRPTTSQSADETSPTETVQTPALSDSSMTSASNVDHQRRRPSSTSPPPYKSSNGTASGAPRGFFGDLLHPNNDKWSPLSPLLPRGRESNLRT